MHEPGANLDADDRIVDALVDLLVDATVRQIREEKNRRCVTGGVNRNPGSDELPSTHEVNYGSTDHCIGAHTKSQR